MRRESGIFYGWVVVAVAIVGLFFSGAPIVVYSFGVFLKPLSQEFHVGRGAISLAFTIHHLVGAFCTPVIGLLVDRYGARKVVIPGLTLCAAALISALAIGSHLWQLYLFFLILGPITAATSPVPYGAVISRWFDRHRGLALGLIMAGIGAGAVVMPPAMERVIAHSGWRMAFAGVGCAILLIPIGLVAAFLNEDPKQKRLLPDDEENSATRAAATRPALGIEWGEIWRSRLFWLLISAFCLIGASVNACVVHMAALLNDRGLTAHQAALGSSILGISIMTARLSSGYLQDRFFAPRVAMAIFGLSGLGMLMLAAGSGGPLALAAAFLVGLGIGAEADIIAFIMSRYFGLRAFGTAFGFAFGSFVLAGGIGGLMMGVGFDRTDSYALPLSGFFMATMIAVALFTRLGPYRYSVAPRPEEPSARVVEA